MKSLRICVQLSEAEKAEIERQIKLRYPKVKNISELVRAALSDFLSKSID